MDTQEARTQLRELAAQASEIVERIAAGSVPSGDDKLRLRRLVVEARVLLPDAGYPGEGAWRGLQRASIGAETLLDHADPTFWQQVAEELRASVDTLESLVRPGWRRESDFHIVG
jgi:hypothetical protein